MQELEDVLDVLYEPCDYIHITALTTSYETGSFWFINNGQTDQISKNDIKVKSRLHVVVFKCLYILHPYHMH